MNTYFHKIVNILIDSFDNMVNDRFTSNFTWGTPPINNPTENLRTRIQRNEGEADVRLPYQNKKNVVQIKVGRLPYLSAIIPHNGAPIIIPKK